MAVSLDFAALLNGRLLWLTESGARLHNEMVPFAMRRNEIIAATLTTDERRQLDLLLSKLYAQLPAVEQVSRKDSFNV